MAQAKRLGEEEKKLEAKEAEQKKKDFILAIANAFVSFVGEEAAAAAGMATLARSIAIAGEAANRSCNLRHSLGVGSIVKAERSGTGLKAAAAARGEIKASEICSMGDLFRNNDNTLQDIMGICKSK
ncbi:hypothetical protein N7456_012374 [Penicillium angulare]|uniref:Uncharacterized protein n=1 Tax=Penicillium angulare TaxID=116970 RepID=A0A9W9EVG1_9EURO|nr:hypothetical protein N7456_012374 [Penicillium angulare]